MEDESMNISRSCTVLLLLAAPALTLQAADAPPGPPALIGFQSVDANHDGKVSVQEAKSVADLSAEFLTLDADQDSLLTPLEYARWSRAADVSDALPSSPATGPGGSAGAQHMPEPR
jgi:hypothetical protein